jgi:hypothetical protein
MSPDTAYLPPILLETLSEDLFRREEVLDRKPTVFVQPGDRTDPSHGAYWTSNSQNISRIGFIVQSGSHTAKQPPMLHTDVALVTVIDRTTKKLSKVTGQELLSMYHEIDDISALQTYLQKKYPSQTIATDSTITLYTVQYV